MKLHLVTNDIQGFPTVPSARSTDTHSVRTVPRPDITSEAGTDGVWASLGVRECVSAVWPVSLLPTNGCPIGRCWSGRAKNHVFWVAANRVVLPIVGARRSVAASCWSCECDGARGWCGVVLGYAVPERVGNTLIVRSFDFHRSVSFVRAWCQEGSILFKQCMVCPSV